MTDQSKVQTIDDGRDPTAQEFESLVHRLTSVAGAIEGSLTKDEETALRSNPWMADVTHILSTVAKVGSTVLPFLEQYPHLTTATYNTLVIGGVAAGALSLGVLAYRLLAAGVRSSVVKAKVLVSDTCEYLQQRLPRLHRRVQQLDDVVLPLKRLAEDGNVQELKKLFGEFCETVRLCRLDIDECVAKMAELGPVLDKCVRQLKRTLVVTSTFSGLFGTAGFGSIALPGFGWAVAGACSIPTVILGKLALDCATLRKYFVEHKSKCDSINSDLKRVKIRLDSHVDSLQLDGIAGCDSCWDLKC